MGSVVLWLLVSVALADELRGTCVRVLDGDTIEVIEQPTIAPVKVRLAQIDAPEKAQDYGVVSKVNLADMVLNKEVVVEFDKKDRYGRVLGQVYLEELESDGEVHRYDVNLAQVASGMAWVYKDYPYQLHYLAAETEARNGKKGLWKDPFPLPPWYYRKSLRDKHKAE